MAGEQRVEQFAKAVASVKAAEYLGPDVLRALRAMPPEAQAIELPIVELALTNPALAHDALLVWRTLRDGRRARGAAARLTGAVRKALVRRVLSKVKTVSQVLAEAQRLAAASPEEAERLTIELLAPIARLDNAHSLYAYAARASSPGALPQSLPHHGGPTPKITARGYVEVGLALGQFLKPRFTAAEEARWAAALPLLEQAVASPLRRPLVSPATAPDVLLQLAAQQAHGAKTLHEKVIRGVIVEARTAITEPDKIGSSLRPAAKNAALAAGTVERQRALLELLDAELVRLDCVAAFIRQGQQPKRAVTRGLWRAGPAGGKASAWMAELDDGHWALLSKIGRFWTLTEGPPDDVLATVPGELFAQAVACAHSWSERSEP